MNRWLALANEPEENRNSLPDTRQKPYKRGFLPVLAGCRVKEINVESDTDNTAPVKSDAEIYADALRIYGPSSYGALACVLGWGAGRSSAAETVLRKAGRIAYNRIGKGTLIE